MKDKNSAVCIAATLTFLTVIVFAGPARPNAQTEPAPAVEIGPPGAPDDVLSPIEEMGYGDFRGVIHAHSYLSHDSQGTPARIIGAARTVGVQFILMSDHPSQYSAIHGLRGMHGGVYFLPGTELSAEGGSLLALNIRENIHGPDTQAKIDHIHRQGGLAVLSHIEGMENIDFPGWDAMEIYNAHYDALMDGKADKTFALLGQIKKNPDRVWLSILDRPDLYLSKWDAILAKRKAPGIAANDSHENVVFNGVQLDTYERSYGLVNTHLFLMELSGAEIMNAIRLGHAYVCFEVFAHCRGFSFIATDGKTIGIMGDDYALNPKAPSGLRISVPKPADIRLLKDGEVIRGTTGTTLDYDLAEPGVYRVEAYISAGKKMQPWIFSNPIYVR